jgi:hypothetical protein
MHALQSVSRFVGGNEQRRAVYVTLYNYNVLDKKQKVNVVVIRSLSLSVYTITWIVSMDPSKTSLLVMRDS